MTVGVYFPPQAQHGPCPVLYWLSGLTRNEQNFITNAGAQRYAAEHGVIVVAPDPSPPRNYVAHDAAYVPRPGAGSYLNPPSDTWSRPSPTPHYKSHFHP